MENFKKYLEKVGEIGYVEAIVASVVYVSGLPGARPNEVVIFEGGDKGYVLSLGEMVEVLILSASKVAVGTKVARCDEVLTLRVSEDMLGKTLDPLGNVLRGVEMAPDGKAESRPYDVVPMEILKRKNIVEPLETGVTIVDLVNPLAKGQRELVIGDRNTGKTSFLLQAVSYQAKRGIICVYAGVGKKKTSIKRLSEFFEKEGISENCIFVTSSSSDPGSLIYLTPFAAMTIAEYFRDQGKDTLVILDDMTNHAKAYREISLLSKRFPGRNSYPGDIFYVHSRLLERAGSFEKASITCIPVAESVLGDLAGYIQTNLMSMTDGHIYFDSELMNQGKFPPINPFLSVTRVGLQTQKDLFRDISRVLTTFLVSYEKLKQYLHFGAELNETVRRTLSFGEKVETFFGQPSSMTRPTNASAFILAIIWSGYWKESLGVDLEEKIQITVNLYNTNEAIKREVDKLLSTKDTFSEVIDYLRLEGDKLIASLNNSSQGSRKEAFGSEVAQAR